MMDSLRMLLKIDSGMRFKSEVGRGQPSDHSQLTGHSAKTRQNNIAPPCLFH